MIDELWYRDDLIPGDPSDYYSFDDIEMIGPEWLYCKYSNGDDGGYMLVRFYTGTDGDLEFELIDFT